MPPPRSSVSLEEGKRRARPCSRPLMAQSGLCVFATCLTSSWSLSSRQHLTAKRPGAVAERVCVNSSHRDTILSITEQTRSQGGGAGGGGRGCQNEELRRVKSGVLQGLTPSVESTSVPWKVPLQMFTPGRWILGQRLMRGSHGPALVLVFHLANSSRVVSTLAGLRYNTVVKPR